MPQECWQSVPDWILTSAAVAAKRQYTHIYTHTRMHTHAHTHTYILHACTYHERDMKPAQRGVARDPNTGESLDARCAARMERNGMEVCVYVCVAYSRVYVRVCITMVFVCVHVHALAHCARGVLYLVHRAVPALWD